MRAALFALASLALSPLPVLASGVDWSLLSTPGAHVPAGHVNAVASSPTIPGLLLIGVTDLQASGGGVYRSMDDGVSWTKTALSDPQVYSVFDIKFAPNGTALAGTNDGLWQSTDGGVTWSAVPTGLSFPRAHEIEFAPGSSTDLWVSFETPNPALGHSTDGGATWSYPSLPPLPLFMNCEGIVITAAAPGLIAAAFSSFQDGSRILISKDGGATWANKTGPLVSANLTDLDTDGAKLWATSNTLGFGMQSGLSWSADLGQTWNQLFDPSWPVALFSCFHADEQVPSTLYLGSDGGGVYRSTDGGASWSTNLAGTAGAVIDRIESKAGAPGLLVGTQQLGFMQSADGLSFSLSNGSLSLGTPQSLVASPLDPDELAMAYEALQGTGGGLITSQDGGLTWVAEGLPSEPFTKVRFDPAGTLYAVSSLATATEGNRLWRRDPLGWTNLGTGVSALGWNELHAVGFFEGQPQQLLTGGQTGLTQASAAIWRTQDGGVTWSLAHTGAPGSGPITDFLVLPDGTGQKVLATYGDSAMATGGVLRSLDGGATWLPVTTGLPSGFAPRSLSASPTDSSRVYIAGAGGIAVSLDSGSTWSAPVDTTHSEVVVVDRERPERVFRALGAGTPERSEDGGVTWTPTGSPLVNPNSPAPAATHDLTLASGSCGKLLFAAGNGAWVQPEASCALVASADSVSGNAGGSIGFSIDMGPAFGGDMSWLLATGAGSSPGLVLDGVLLPLNADPILVLSLTQANTAVFQGTLGALDPMGRGMATLNVPAGTVLPPGTLHFAAATFQLAPVVKVTGATNATPIEWLP